MTEPPDNARRDRGLRPRRPAVVSFALALAAVGALSIWLDAPRPEVRWIDAASGTPLGPVAEAETGQAFRVELELPRPMHVYVASHDLVRGTLALLPSTTLRTDLPANPLPAGAHTLPGSHDGQALRWDAGDDVGLCTVVLLASEQPLIDLHRDLSRCRQVGNAAFPGRPVLAAYAPPAGMEVTPPRSAPANPLLEAATGLTDLALDGGLTPLPGHPEVLVAVLRLHTELAGNGDLETARRELAERIGPLLEGTLPMPAGPQTPAAPPAAGGR